MIYNRFGDVLDEAYGKNGETLDTAYDKLGNVVFSGEGGGGGDQPEGIEKYENYSAEMLSRQTPCGQDFAYYGGYLVAATSTSDVLKVIDFDTWTSSAGNFTVTGIGHCNSMVFSDEFYDENDVLPLLCTISGGLRFYRIANTFDSASIVKQYTLQTPPVDTSTVWYGLGFLDGYLYTIGYTSGSYQASSSNFILLAKYDYSHPVDNGDGTYTLPLIKTKRREWFECIQGSQIHDGYLWVNSGFTNPNHVYALDLDTAEILLDIGPTATGTLEPEAISWVNDYTLLIGTKNSGSNTGMYKITFPDLAAYAKGE